MDIIKEYMSALGKKSAEKMHKKRDPDFYKRIGKLGGRPKKKKL